MKKREWKDQRKTPEDIVDRIGTIANRPDIIEAKSLMILEIRALVAAHKKAILEVLDEQANDPALWFSAESAPEVYMQQALRRLHAVIEDEKWAIDEFKP